MYNKQRLAYVLRSLQQQQQQGRGERGGQALTLEGVPQLSVHEAGAGGVSLGEGGCGYTDV